VDYDVDYDTDDNDSNYDDDDDTDDNDSNYDDDDDDDDDVMAVTMSTLLMMLCICCVSAAERAGELAEQAGTL